jgi:uncharacterized small protein (DUF1192 family)
MKLRAEALTKVLGVNELSQRIARREQTLAGIDRGLLKREIFAATTAKDAQTQAA